MHTLAMKPSHRRVQPILPEYPVDWFRKRAIVTCPGDVKIFFRIPCFLLREFVRQLLHGRARQDEAQPQDGRGKNGFTDQEMNDKERQKG